MELPLAARRFRHYCLQCNIRFPTEDSLLNHITRHALESRCAVSIDRNSVPKKYDTREPLDSAVDEEAIVAEEQFDRFIPVLKLQRSKKRATKGRFAPNWVPRKKRRVGPGKGTADVEVDAAVAIATKNIEVNEPALPDATIGDSALKELSYAPVVDEQQIPEAPDTFEQLADGEIGGVSNDLSRTLTATPEPDVPDAHHNESANLSEIGSKLNSPNKASHEVFEPSVTPRKVLNTIDLQFPNISTEEVVASNGTGASSTGSAVCWTEATTGLGENGKTGMCPICKEQTLTNYDLLKHLEDHCAEVELTEPRFTCIHPRCKKDFKMKGNLTRHYNQSGHASPCTYCGSIFKTKSALADHERSVHAKKLKQRENTSTDPGIKKGNNPAEKLRTNGSVGSSGTMQMLNQTHVANTSRKLVYNDVLDPVNCAKINGGPGVETNDRGITVGHQVSANKPLLQETTPVNSSVLCCAPKDVAPVPVRRMSNGASYEHSNTSIEATPSDISSTSFGIQKVQSQPFPPLLLNMDDNAGVSVSYKTASNDDRPKMTVPLQSVLTHYTSGGNLVSPIQLTANVTLCPLNTGIRPQPPNAFRPQPPPANPNQMNFNNAQLPPGRSLLIRNHPRFMNNHAPSVNANHMPHNGHPSQRTQGFDARKEMAAPNPYMSNHVFPRACAMQPPIRNTQPTQTMQFSGSGIGPLQRVGLNASTRMPDGSSNQARLALNRAVRPGMNPRQQLQQMLLPSRIMHQQPTPVVSQPPAASIANVPSSPMVVTSFQNSAVQHQEEFSNYVPTAQGSQQYFQHAQPQVLMSTGLHHQNQMQPSQTQSAMRHQAPPIQPGSTFPPASNSMIPAQSSEGDWGIQYVTRYNSSNPISTTVTSSIQNIGHISRPTSGVQYCPTTLKETRGEQLLATMTMNHMNYSVSYNTVGNTLGTGGGIQPSCSNILSVHLMNSYRNSKRVLRCGTCDMPARSHQSLHFHRQFCRILRTCANCRQVFKTVHQLQDHRKGKCLKPVANAVSNTSRASVLPVSVNSDVQNQQQLNGSQHVQGNTVIINNPMLVQQLSSFPVQSSTLGIVSVTLPCSTTITSTVSNAMPQSAQKLSATLPTIVVPPNGVVLPATCPHDTVIHRNTNEALAKPMPSQVEPPVTIVEDDGVNIVETPVPEVTSSNVSEDINLEEEQPGDASKDVACDEETVPFLVISDVTTVTKSTYDAHDSKEDPHESSPRHENFTNGYECSKKAALPSPGCEESPALEPTLNDLGKADKSTSEVVVDCPNIPAEDGTSKIITDCPSTPCASNSSNADEDSSTILANHMSPSPARDTQNKQEDLHAVDKVCDTDCASGSRENKDEEHSASLEDEGSGCNRVVEECLAEDSLPDRIASIDVNSPSTENSLISNDLPDIDMDYVSNTADESDHVFNLNDVDDYASDESNLCGLFASEKNDAIICQVCDMKFPSMELLDEHWPVHRHARKRKCIKCTKMFPSKAALFTHFRSHLLSCRKVPKSAETVMKRTVVGLGNKSCNGKWLVPVVDAAIFRQTGGKLDKLLNNLGAKFVTVQDLKNAVDNVVPVVYPVHGNCVE